jgi:alpha-L-fucosidase 2
MSAWSAHLFYLHWRYTMDEAFLRERAYPWASDVGTCMLGLLKPDANGRLVLPLSSSPEIFDNSHKAWLRPNSNYDLMSLRMLFLALAEMAGALGRQDDVAKWRRASDQLGPYHVRADGTLRLSADADLPGSHRHLSNLMGLHPFNLITAEGGAADARMINASLAEWDAMATKEWCGYSFSWMSALRARVGDAEEALRLLAIYAKAFILRNGFHANGDQTKSGHSNFTYRPFTLEGNFLAMHAVHEMLLQSWSATPGVGDTEVVRIFPATPARWQDASFGDLRTEGGHAVSARREGGVTTWFRVKAGRAGVIRIRDSFNGRVPSWSRPGGRKSGANYEVAVKAGEVIEATVAR